MLASILFLAMMQATRDDGRGSELFRNCQAAIREVDSTSGGVDADLRPAERCFDYVRGFSDGLSAGGQSCFENASRYTIIRIYVKFMQTNPKYMDESDGIGFYIAMMKTFPCPAKK